MFVWDEVKREKNLAKHGYDFADAHLVYGSPSKVTVASPRNNEARFLATAFVQVLNDVLALAYLEVGAKEGDVVRVISFRRASRRERMRYERSREQN